MIGARETQDGLTADAIRVLTQAAHRSTDEIDGLDFADFVAHVLAATAANVGGPERLLAARPGSWEANQLHALIQGTIGHEPNDWHAYRTERLLIPLNVAELIEKRDLHPGLLGLDEAIDAIGLRYSTADDAETLDAWDAEIDAAVRRYETEYRIYANRFQTAVKMLGRSMRPPVDIDVSADANPTSSWWSATAVTNPTEHDADALVVAVWRAAHDAMPLPSVDVRPITSTAGRPACDS